MLHSLRTTTNDPDRVEPRVLAPNELEVLETIAADLIKHVGQPVKA